MLEKAAGIPGVAVVRSGVNRRSGFMVEGGLVSVVTAGAGAGLASVGAGFVVCGRGRLNSTAIGIMESRWALRFRGVTTVEIKR